MLKKASDDKKSGKWVILFIARKSVLNYKIVEEMRLCRYGGTACLSVFTKQGRHLILS